MKNKKQNNSVGEKEKTFNKKNWRERKYSHKFKVQQFEQRRQRGVLREYHKELRALGKSAPPKQQQTSSAPSGKPGRLSAMHAARLAGERVLAEKQQRREAQEQKKKEREEALRKYQAKKTETYKKLSRKTKKGQPVMKGRLEMLLEKIQKQCAQ